MSSASDIHCQSSGATSLLSGFFPMIDREMSFFRGNIASKMKRDEGESSDHVSYPRW